MSARLLDLVDAAARTQHGILTRQQLVDVGVSASAVDSWVRRGRLVRQHAGVYRLAGAPPTWRAELTAAVLAGGPGAVASHRAAAFLWGLVTDQPDVEISVSPSRSARLQGVVVHRRSSVSRFAGAHRDGIPVTDPLTTMAEIGTVLNQPQVADALERGLTARLYSLEAVERRRFELGTQGRNGVGVLGRVLDRRALGRAPGASILELRMAALCRRVGLPPFVFQYEIRDATGRLIARVDFCWPVLKLIVEVDGWETHGSPAALAADLERQNAVLAALEPAGWRLRRFPWEMVVRRPQLVATTLLPLLAA